MIFIDKHRTELLNQYLSSVLPHEQNLKFFERYVSEVENFISRLGDRLSMSLDKVYIGSQVSILYEEDRVYEQFTICFPEQSNPEHGYISFLSPVGKQLLLKGLEERVVLYTPNGETSVVIKDIHFTEDDLDEPSFSVE